MPMRREFLAGLSGLLTFGLFTQRVMAEVGVSDPASLALGPAKPAKDQPWLVMERICSEGYWSDRYQVIATADCQTDAEALVPLYTRDALRGLNLETYLWSELVDSVEQPSEPRILAILNWCRAVGRARQMSAYDQVLDQYLYQVRQGPYALEEYLPPDLELPGDLSCEEAVDFNRLIDSPLHLAEPAFSTAEQLRSFRPDDNPPPLARYIELRRELGFLPG